MLHKCIVLLLLFSSLAMFGCSKGEQQVGTKVSSTIKQIKSDASKSFFGVQYLMSENGVLTIRGVGTTNSDELMTSLMTSGFDSEDVTQIIICEGVTGIGEYSFEQYFNVTSVSMANSVKVIEEAAFTSCEKLEEMNLSDGLLRIDREAFSYCGALRRLTLPESLEFFAKDAIPWV